MRLNQFQYLIALKKEGTFSGAARRLYISQPSISNAIKDLEIELDCQLLHRDNRGVQFTEKGEKILDQAAVIMDAIQDICRIAGRDASFEYPISIGSIPHLCGQVLLKAMMALKESHPDLELKIEEDMNLALLEKVERHQLDMALVQMCNIPHAVVNRAMKQGVVFDEIFRDKMFFACRPGHPLLQKKNLTIEDILKYPFVNYHDSVENEIQEAFDRYHYTGQIVHISEVVSLRWFVANSDSVVSQTFASLKNGNAAFDGKLVAIDPDNISWDVSVCLIHKGESMSEASRVVRREIERQCRSNRMLMPRIEEAP